MVVIKSATARLMFAVMTVGVGLTTIRTQADFWFGALTALAGIWVVMVLSELADGKNPRPRASRVAFLVAFLAGLIFGFGPWSDASMRSLLAEDSAGTARYVQGASPVTLHLVQLANGLLAPVVDRRMEIFYTNLMVSDVRIGLTGPGCFETAESIAPVLRGEINKVVVFRSYQVYLDGLYLLASLGMGAVAGSGVGLVASAMLGKRQPESMDQSNIAHP